MKLVLPNATVVTVEESSTPDLYFALRGGFNNFGIITAYTVRVLEQAEVYSASYTVSCTICNTLLSNCFILRAEDCLRIIPFSRRSYSRLLVIESDASIYLTY